MSTPLHPIVLRDPVIASDSKFTSLGEGLLFQGVPRERPDTLRDLLLGGKGASGIADKDKSKAWWRAQNAFYGLHHSAASPIAGLRAVLEGALRTGSLVWNYGDVEFDADTRFRELNALVRTHTGPGVPTAVIKGARKATSAPAVTAKSTGAGSGATKVPAVKVKAPAKASAPKASTSVAIVKKPAAAPPQASSSKLAPPKPKVAAPKKRKVGSDDDLIVETKPKAAKQTARKQGSTSASASASASGFSLSRDLAQFSSPSSSSVAKPKPKPKAKVEKSSSAGPPPYSSQSTSAVGQLTVGGLWHLDSPRMSDQYPQFDDPYRFIFRQPSFDGSLDGSFSLGLLHGALRSLPGQGTTSVQTTSQGSASYLRFEWRGREQDGEITDGRGWIRFFADGQGTQAGRCKGMLDSTFGPWEFEGRRDAGAGHPAMEHEWRDFSEQRRRYEETARWGGGGGYESDEYGSDVEMSSAF